MFKLLTGERIVDDDLRELCPERYTSLFEPWFRLSDAQIEQLCVTWPDGSDVTPSQRRSFHKHMFLSELGQCDLSRNYRPAVEFRDGFFDIVPAEMRRHLGSANDLRQESFRPFAEVAVNEFREHVTFTGIADVDGANERMVWESLHKLNAHERNQLISFITAYSHPPVGGLREMCEDHQKITVRFVHDCSRLPEAQTCFFQLVLPVYSDSDTCVRMLRRAISSPCEFRFV